MEKYEKVHSLKILISGYISIFAKYSSVINPVSKDTKSQLDSWMLDVTCLDCCHVSCALGQGNLSSLSIFSLSEDVKPMTGILDKED